MTLLIVGLLFFVIAFFAEYFYAPLLRTWPKAFLRLGKWYHALVLCCLRDLPLGMVLFLTSKSSLGVLVLLAITLAATFFEHDPRAALTAKQFEFNQRLRIVNLLFNLAIVVITTWLSNPYL